MPTDLQRAIDGLAHQLGRSVAVDDAKMRLVVHSPHRGPVDAARLGSLLNREVPTESIQWAHSLGVAQAEHAVRLPANPALGFDYPRLGVPVRSGGLLLGYLWIIDPAGDMTEGDVASAERCAVETGAIMHRDQLLDQMRTDQERQLVQALLSPDADVRAQAARRADELSLLPSGSCVAVVIVRGVADVSEPETELALVTAFDMARRRLHSRAWLHGTVGDKAVAVVPTAHDDDNETARDVARRLLDALAHTAGSAVHAGIGAPATLGSVVESYQQAADSLSVGERISLGADVVAWTDLGVYRLLARLPDEQLRVDVLTPGVTALLGTDAGEDLVQTLECYLDHGGAVKESAAALFVHRGSLYHRLTRIERITGADLSSGDDRLSLHLGIKAARLLGLVTAPPVGTADRAFSLRAANDP
jgi:sugar diacid utilization regulator